MHHLTIRHTQPGEVVRQPQFQPALNLVRPSKTNMVRFAQRNFSSRCTPFARSITYDAPTCRKSFHLPKSRPRTRMPDAHARRLEAVIGFGESFQVIQRASCHQRHPRPHPPAPRRLHWFYYVIPGGAWATLARTLDDPSSSNVF